MAKPIRLSEFAEQIREQIHLQAENAINGITCDTTLTFKVSIKDMFKERYGKEAAIVNITTDAYYKMRSLINKSNEELAAHGVVVKNSDYEYTIVDILVYPQQVTAITVVAADAYSQWLAELDDNIFNALRFQMHSHVNMGVTPSNTDLAFYEDMLRDVEDYYIFAIINKRSELFINIYDVEHNIILEKNDIDVYIIDSHGNNVDSWADAQIKEHIKPKVFVPIPPKPEIFSYPIVTATDLEKKECDLLPPKEKKETKAAKKKAEDDAWYERYYARQKALDDLQRRYNDDQY